MIRQAKAKGFTLIELIAVIVILGVLAAVAAPKFVDLSSAAKVAALEGVAGTMRSTAQMTKAAALAQGIEPANSNPSSGQSQFLVNVAGAVRSWIGETFAQKAVPNWVVVLRWWTLLI